MKTIYMWWGEPALVPDIGETVLENVYFSGHELDKKSCNGTVIYVHPQLRYYTVEFGTGNRKYRESYIIGR